MSDNPCSYDIQTVSKKSICSESSLRSYNYKEMCTCIIGEIVERAIVSWILYILNSNLL